MQSARDGAGPNAYGAPAATSDTPALSFAVEDAAVMEFAAAPTLRFALRVTNSGRQPIRAVALTTQLRIVPARRSYTPAERSRLMELFGEPQRWGTTMHDLFWTQVALVVPAFTGSTRIDLPVPCTYDLDVAAAKFFHGVTDGEVPITLLFSGTVFYDDEHGRLQTGRIAHDRDADWRLPRRLWAEMMARYFPNSAWLRVRQDVFDRLVAYRTSRVLGTWDETIETLLEGSERARSG